MSEKDEVKNKIKKIISESALPKKNSDKSTINQTVGGNNAIAIIGEVGMVVKTEKIVEKTVVKPTPGNEHISEEQAAVLHNLIHQVIELNNKIKKRPISYRAAWLALNNKMKVASYRMIKASDFNNAVKYLRSWIGRLSSAKSAPRKDPTWRKRKYAFIFTNVKKYNLQERLDTYLLNKYKTMSLSSLGDVDLQRVYRAVYEWKRSLEKKS